MLVFLFFVGQISVIFGEGNGTSVERRVKRWGNYGNWYGGGGGGQAPYAPPPNNNVAIGYPTAYGLGLGSRGAPEGGATNPVSLE